MGVVSLHNQISQFPIINQSLILSVLFLWTTLTNTDFDSESGLEEQNIKEEGFLIGSVVSGIGSLIQLDLKTLMTLFLAVKKSTDNPQHNLAIEICQILPLGTPN